MFNVKQLAPTLAVLGGKYLFPVPSTIHLHVNITLPKRNLNPNTKSGFSVLI